MLLNFFVMLIEIKIWIFFVINRVATWKSDFNNFQMDQCDCCFIYLYSESSQIVEFIFSVVNFYNLFGMHRECNKMKCKHLQSVNFDFSFKLLSFTCSRSSGMNVWACQRFLCVSFAENIYMDHGYFEAERHLLNNFCLWKSSLRIWRN